MKKISIKSKQRCEFIDITNQIHQALSEAKMKDGICVVFCPHTTAGLTINENADPSVQKDIIKHLKKMIPENSGFLHSEGNSDAHIKASLMGSSLNIIIESGNLVLGTWQGVYFCEFDGPRNRKCHIEIIPKN